MKYFAIFMISTLIVMAIVIQPVRADGFATAANNTRLHDGVRSLIGNLIIGTMFGGAEGIWIAAAVGTLMFSVLRPLFKLFVM